MKVNLVFHLVLARMPKIKNLSDSSCWLACEATGVLYYCKCLLKTLKISIGDKNSTGENYFTKHINISNGSTQMKGQLLIVNYGASLKL